MAFSSSGTQVCTKWLSRLGSAAPATLCAQFSTRTICASQWARHHVKSNTMSSLITRLLVRPRSRTTCPARSNSWVIQSTRVFASSALTIVLKHSSSMLKMESRCCLITYLNHTGRLLILNWTKRVSSYTACKLIPSAVGRARAGTHHFKHRPTDCACNTLMWGKLTSILRSQSVNPREETAWTIMGWRRGPLLRIIGPMIILARPSSKILRDTQAAVKALSKINCHHFCTKASHLKSCPRMVSIWLGNKKWLLNSLQNQTVTKLYSNQILFTN